MFRLIGVVFVYYNMFYIGKSCIVYKGLIYMDLIDCIIIIKFFVIIGNVVLVLFLMEESDV